MRTERKAFFVALPMKGWKQEGMQEPRGAPVITEAL